MRTFTACAAILLACAAACRGAGTDVRAHGAVGDGTTSDTAAVQRAIDACAASGGGTVAFPTGSYRCGSLHLRSRVTLRLEAGATILGSRSAADYDPPETLPFRNDADEETSYFHHALIWGEDLQDVAVVGEGAIDCAGVKRGGPKGIALKRCRFVQIRGIRMLNCPNYNISLLGTDFVTIDGVSILNGFADGIDPDACRNVRISNCHIDAHDDAIVPKSSHALGERRACENVCVTNCTLATDAYCFKLGTESGGDFRQIAVSNCVMSGRSPERRAGAGIALETVDGADLQGVVVSNITLRGVHAPIFLRLGNRGRDLDAPRPGRLRDVVISGIEATGADVPCSITGLPGHPVTGVTLSGIRLRYDAAPPLLADGVEVPEVPAKYPLATMFGPLPAFGLYCRHVEGITIRDLCVSPPPAWSRGAALACDDVSGLRIDGLEVDRSTPDGPCVDLASTRDALIRGAVAPPGAGVFLRVRGERSARIRIAASALDAAQTAVQTGAGVPRAAVRIDRGRVRAETPRPVRTP